MKKLTIGIIIGILLLATIVAGTLIEKDIGLDSKYDYDKLEISNVQVGELNCFGDICKFELKGSVFSGERFIHRYKDDKQEKTQAELESERDAIVKTAIESYAKEKSTAVVIEKKSDGYLVKIVGGKT